MSPQKHNGEKDQGAPMRVVVTGPESAGKTTLARLLARHYRTAWAPEYSRHYLERLGRPYDETDLLIIAQGQLIWEAFAAFRAASLVFFDTSLEVIKVWSEYRYRRLHPWIAEQLAGRPPDLYLLCTPDLPWVEDPLRENPHDRSELLDWYRRELGRREVPFHLISGARQEERLARAIAAVNRLMIEMRG